MSKSTVDHEFEGTERFEVKRRIGQGGMGVVYEVLDRETDTLVALKTLRRIEADALYRFKSEFRSLQDIEHPNLIRLGELIYENGVWFFTMEYVDGIDILSYVRQSETKTAGGTIGGSSQGSQKSGDPGDTQPPRPPESSDSADHETQQAPTIGFDEYRLRNAMGQLARAIAALHGAQLLHRDIKPSNVLVDQKGRVVLLDFGLVTELNQDTMTSLAGVVGTAAYMAPEQAMGRSVGPECDWYAFGMVLYQAMLGHLPFRGTFAEILMDKQEFEPPRPRMLNASVPQDLDALCSELLRIDPRTRPPERRILDRLSMSPETQVTAPITLTSRTTQTTPFVGREQEMARLRRAYERSRSEPVTVFVQGQSGTGKSELVRRFTSGLHQEIPQLVVLASRCYERESVPYNAFDGIADELSRYMMRLARDEAARLLPPRADLLPQLFPVLRRVEVIAREPQRDYSKMDPLELRNRMFHAFRELVIILADQHPLILVIDDFQWASADSRMLLSELMHPPDAPTLLLLATERTEQSIKDHAHEERETTGVAGDVRYIWVDLLPPPAARELASLLLPDRMETKEAAAKQIAQEARGHPLFIQELVRHLESGEITEEGEMRLDDALWARISRLPANARRLLEMVAVARSPLLQETVSLAVELEFNECIKWARLLRAAFLTRSRGTRGTDRIEAYHDRVRSAVLANISEEQRRRHHGRLAIALEQTGVATSDPHMLVTHFEAAGEAERAAWHAADAARRADRALAFDQAAEFFRVALELGRYEREEQRHLRLRLGEALVNAGRGAEAAGVFLAAAEGADPVTRLECERQAAEQLLCSGHVDQGLETVRRILASMNVQLPSTPNRALMSLIWRRVKVRGRGIRWKERVESQISRQELMHADVYNAVASGLAMVDTVRGMDFQARGLLAALKTGETGRIVRAIAREATFLASQGRGSLPKARQMWQKGSDIAERSAKPVLQTWMLAVDGIISYFEGRLHTAAQQLGEAENSFLHDMTSGVAWELNNVRLFRLWTLLHSGSYQALCSLMDHYTREAVRRGDRFADTSIRRSANLAWLVRGLPSKARRDLERAAWMPPAGTMHLQHWWEVEARSQLVLYEGRASTAQIQYAPYFQAVERSLLTRIQIVRASANAYQGRLALAAAAATRDPSELLKQASRQARRLAGEKISYATIWGNMLRAGIAIQSGQKERCLQLLRQTIELGQQHDMPNFTEAARRRLGELLGGDEGRELTDRADNWLSAEGIKDPVRILEVLAPGFHRPSTKTPK